MIVSIHQPAYLPWLGYLERIARSDMHIVLDHVQLEKNSFINRNKIRTQQGWSWLTVPLITKGLFGQLPISCVQVDTQQLWQKKHWATLQQSYNRATYFHEYSHFFTMFYQQQTWSKLLDLCYHLLQFLLQAFSISTKIVLSSELKPQTIKEELVVELCQKVGATEYISGALGKNYLNEALFEQAGITLTYQDYQHPIYKQQLFSEFIPNLAAIDLLFNYGKQAREIMLSGNKPPDSLESYS